MKRGLVFCGGGSKGAYQMGAWQALEELGIKFDIVTGTSIGCLNAAMYTQNDYQRCYDLWDKIKIDMIMSNDLTLDEKSIRSSLKKKQDLVPILKKYVQDFGVDISPFLKLMDEYTNIDKLKNSNVDFGIVAATFPSLKPVEVRVKDLKDEEIKKYILASCSCFPIFPLCKINDKRYLDGGYYDNLPINFAINLGADEIVALDLSVDGTHPEYMNVPYVKYIKPNRPLGSFLRFDHSIIVNNRIMGYNDTMKAYGKYKGYRYTFINNSNLEIAQRFILYISKKVGLMKKLKIKTNVKPEREGDIMYLLRKYTINQLDYEDYLLRAMEIAGDLFNLDYLTIYEIDEYMNQIIKNILEIDSQDNLLDSYHKLKSDNKKRDYLSKIDDKLLLKYLYDNMINEELFDDSLLLNIIASKPVIFIIYALIKNWSK